MKLLWLLVSIHALSLSVLEKLAGDRCYTEATIGDIVFSFRDRVGATGENWQLEMEFEDGGGQVRNGGNEFDIPAAVSRLIWRKSNNVYDFIMAGNDCNAIESVQILKDGLFYKAQMVAETPTTAELPTIQLRSPNNVLNPVKAAGTTLKPNLYILLIAASFLFF